METYGFCKGGGNRLVKKGEIGFQGEIKGVPPGKAIFKI